MNGVITGFTAWNASTSTWGSGTLTGTIFQYAGAGATINTAKVEGSPPGLHLTGSVQSSNGGYGGGGLKFFSCVTVASFTKISMDVYGSAAGCAIELQLQIYDQRPAEQSPPGGCKSDGGATCYNFPAKANFMSPPNSATPTTVSTTLSSLSNWSTVPAGQIVGVQWQFTAPGGTCTPNVTFTNIKFQ